MRIRDIMSAQPEVVSPETTLQEAADKMRNLDCGCLPIGENDKLIGIVTDRDVAIRAVAEGLDPKSTTVKDIMTDKVLYCYEENAIEEVAENMRDQQVRRMIVLNDAKRLVGIVSLGDFATQCENKRLTGELTEGVSQKNFGFQLKAASESPQAGTNKH